MKRLRSRWRIWLRQRAMQGAILYLTKQNQWGPTRVAADSLASTIGDGLAGPFSADQLRAVRGHMACPTIDQFILDMQAAITTLRLDQYVLERLHYVAFTERSMYHYLTTVENLALSPKEAWALFHSTACEAFDILDSLVDTDDDLTDRRYLLLRYEILWQEIYRVYRLFAQLAGYTLPPTAWNPSSLLTRK